MFAAMVTMAACLPFLHTPLTSDESGFLLLAQHWSPGRSLYGDYWVARPPLRLWLFSLTTHLGRISATTVGVTAPGVKVLGAAASGGSVILVGVLARLSPEGRWARRAAVAVASRCCPALCSGCRRPTVRCRRCRRPLRPGMHRRGASQIVAGLWAAIVVFRVLAWKVIGSSASGAAPERMDLLVQAFVASGAALVIWELCGVALGGSYWLHYLAGLVPGLVRMVTIARPGQWPRRVLTVAVAYAALASLAGWVHQVATPAAVSSDARVMSYLREHARAPDGVVVGFGHPDIVSGSGLQSPHAALWSLPVRVRDPHLERVQQVMTGPSAPRWIVVAGDSLDTWGLDAGEAQQYLQRHYVERVTYGDWHIWRRQGQSQEGTVR